MTITPHTRVLIQTALVTRGEWFGTRDGWALRFDQQRSLFTDDAIHWSARKGVRHDGGQVPTVFDACEALRKFTEEK